MSKQSSDRSSRNAASTCGYAARTSFPKYWPTVAVGDRGPGVSSDQALRLFEPYYRSPATAGSGKDGVGLGLSIVKSIVEAHAGQVGVESRRGGGARFWFSIPSVGRSASTKSHLSIVS